MTEKKGRQKEADKERKRKKRKSLREGKEDDNKILEGRTWSEICQLNRKRNHRTCKTIITKNND